MRWKDERRSDNVEDRRRMPAAGVAVGGAGTILFVIIALLLGADPRQLLQQVGQAQQQQGAPAGPGFDAFYTLYRFPEKKK